MAAGRASRRLQRLAAPLKPDQPPFYVRQADTPPSLRDTYPAEGWYWRPAGHPVAIYLAASELFAAAALMRLTERQEQEAAA